MTPAEWAGLGGQKQAARRHHVYQARPRRRNQVWEADLLQVPLLVKASDAAFRPWITWFIDCATTAVVGVTVTPGHPCRDSVRATLRSAVLREEPYGPFGGLPETVRVHRGMASLSSTVTGAFGVLDVGVEDLPAHAPRRKSTIEALSRAAEQMLLAALPGYIHRPRPGKRSSHLKPEVLLTFDEFTARLLDWTDWWNAEHCPPPLRGRTPLQVWQDDPTPLRDVLAADLWTFTLEDATPRRLTTRGVRFRNHEYVGAWMTGRAGIQVGVRFMPHHEHRIEVYHAATGRYLGPAYLDHQATSDQITIIQRRGPYVPTV
jgi:putative transposase